MTWTYLVTDPGNTPLRITAITDDNGTSGTGDEFTPVYVSGDANGDGLLEPGETWLYTSAGVVSESAAAGQYQNTVTVTAVEPTLGTAVDASDVSRYYGTENSITIVKAVNAADPWHPTAREDANAAPGPVLAVGSTVTWTYVVTNTGNTSLDVESVDDDGSGCTGCGFEAMAVLVDGTIAGDTNGNGILDPGETWLFQATGRVTPGPYRNTATVTAQVIGMPTVSVSASDVANEVGTVPGVAVTKKLNGHVAHTPGSPLWVAAGSTDHFSYEVTTTTRESLADVTVTDDNGTPGDASDDLTASYVSGDANGNGLLDPGEVWIFAAQRIAPYGAYSNVVTISGAQVATGTRVWASDVNYSLGITPKITVDKAVDALDPWHLTSIEDANTQPAKELLVGTTAVWTYLLTNTGNAPVTVTTVTDDNGTPGDASDDFTPTYVAGDTNGNGLLDVGETWLYQASTTVHAGPYLNTVQVSATEPVTQQVATGSDVAGYYGDTGAEGLTPGYWKNHTDAWPAGLSPDQLVGQFFGPLPADLAGETLLDALSAGGGGVIALLRQAVSALLSTASQYIAYPWAASTVVAQVDAALASGDATQIDNLQTQLNTWNNREADLTPPVLPPAPGTDAMALVATGTPTPATAPGTLSTAAVPPVLQEAERDWVAAGVSAGTFATVHVVITDLPGAEVGFASGDTIYLDATAAGFGWYTDPGSAGYAPHGSDEYARAGSAAATRIDLLSVLLHELGHVLGLGHGSSARYGDVMEPTIAAGQRRLLPSGSSTSGSASSRVASMPSSRGIRMSNRHTSARSWRARVTACRPSEASPTTSIPGGAVRMVGRSARTMLASSVSRTRMGHAGTRWPRPRAAGRSRLRTV